MSVYRLPLNLCLALLLFVLNPLLCASAAVSTTKVTYWESKTEVTGPSQYFNLDYFSSNPHGSHVQLYIRNGKSTVQFIQENGIKWVIINHTAKIDMPVLVARIQVLLKRLGKKRVKQLSYWPVNEHDYPYRRRTYFQPSITTGMYLNNTGDLTLVRRTNYLGHPCVVLKSPAGPGDNGTNHFEYWMDRHTHMIWRVDYIFVPAADNAAPPSRQTSRILWLKRISHIPAQVLTFPPGTHVIVPVCMGNIKVPTGGTRMHLPPDAAYLGFSLKPLLATVRINPASSANHVPTTAAARKGKR